MISRVLEALLVWIAGVLVLLTAVMVTLGNDEWLYVGGVGIALWIVALVLHRRRHGRIDVYDDL